MLVGSPSASGAASRLPSPSRPVRARLPPRNACPRTRHAHPPALGLTHARRVAVCSLAGAQRDPMGRAAAFHTPLRAPPMWFGRVRHASAFCLACEGRFGRCSCVRVWLRFGPCTRFLAPHAALFHGICPWGVWAMLLSRCLLIVMSVVGWFSSITCLSPFFPNEQCSTVPVWFNLMRARRPLSTEDAFQRTSEIQLTDRCGCGVCSLSRFRTCRSVAASSSSNRNYLDYRI